MNTNLQNEFIRDVCIAILNHTRYPTKAERVQIPKLIVQKYPCMGDKKKYWTPQAPGYVVTLL